jgi:hypothetical protein
MNVDLTGTPVNGPIGVKQEDAREMRSLIRHPVDEDRQVLLDVSVTPKWHYQSQGHGTNTILYLTGN